MKNKNKHKFIIQYDIFLLYQVLLYILYIEFYRITNIVSTNYKYMDFLCI